MSLTLCLAGAIALLPHNFRAAEPSRAPGVSSYAQAAARVIAFWRQAGLFPMQLVFKQIFNDYRS